jgi:uncharacterized protein (UPF0332 family)
VKEIRSLIERANKYIKSAEVLIAQEDYESSVSRTYYAMFYSAEAILLTKDLSFSSHKGVISGFGEHFVKTGIFPREMGRELNRAFEKRQVGDYGHTFVISREEAEQVLAKGRVFIEEIVRKLKTENKLP